MTFAGLNNMKIIRSTPFYRGHDKFYECIVQMPKVEFEEFIAKAENKVQWQAIAERAAKVNKYIIDNRK